MDQNTRPFVIRDEDHEERDRPFNPYRYAASANAKAIIAEAIKLLLNYERRLGLTKNKRRVRDQLTYDLTVDAILSDLMHHHAVGYRTDIYVPRSYRVLGGRSRYRPPAFSKKFPAILDLLSKPEIGFIEQAKAAPMQGAARSTVIRPGPALLLRMDGNEIEADDFDEHPTGETIILKRLKDRTDYWDAGAPEQYDDTPETERYREELGMINDWLASAQLAYDPIGIDGPSTDFDIRDRRLRRIFTQGRFTSGGRLFGGFWQQLRKQERRRGLRIGGEKAVELDYGQVGPRILYGMTGQQPDTDDLYDVPLYGGQRDGIKRVMSAMIFAEERLERFPKNTRKLFRRGDRIDHVVAAIETRHPLIADQFHRGRGHDAQFIESNILVDVLLALRKLGVVALPIHDAVMVPLCKVSIAKEIMLNAFTHHAQVQGTVQVEP